jgi:hypothetical protein
MTSPPRAAIAARSLDADIAPLRLFLALQAGGGYFYNDAVDLAGETGGLLLRLALATGTAAA